MRESVLHHLGAIAWAGIGAIAGWVGMAQVSAPTEFITEKIGALGVLALFGWLGYQFLTQTIKTLSDSVKAIGDKMDDHNKDLIRAIRENKCKHEPKQEA